MVAVLRGAIPGWWRNLAVMKRILQEVARIYDDHRESQGANGKVKHENKANGTQGYANGFLFEKPLETFL